MLLIVLFISIESLQSKDIIGTTVLFGIPDPASDCYRNDDILKILDENKLTDV
jgi:hypothetical protein